MVLYDIELENGAWGIEKASRLCVMAFYWMRNWEFWEEFGIPNI